MAMNVEESDWLFQSTQQDFEYVSRCRWNPVVAAASAVGVLVVGTSPLLFRTGGEVGVPLAGEVGGRGLAAESKFGNTENKDQVVRSEGQNAGKINGDVRGPGNMKDFRQVYVEELGKCKNPLEVVALWGPCQKQNCPKVRGHEYYKDSEYEDFVCLNVNCLQHVIDCEQKEVVTSSGSSSGGDPE